MVLIDDDEYVPRLKWKRGVVEELIKGKDGKVRGVLRLGIKNTIVQYHKKKMNKIKDFLTKFQVTEMLIIRVCNHVDRKEMRL